MRPPGPGSAPYVAALMVSSWKISAGTVAGSHQPAKSILRSSRRPGSQGANPPARISLKRPPRHFRFCQRMVGCRQRRDAIVQFVESAGLIAQRLADDRWRDRQSVLDAMAEFMIEQLVLLDALPPQQIAVALGGKDDHRRRRAANRKRPTSCAAVDRMRRPRGRNEEPASATRAAAKPPAVRAAESGIDSRPSGVRAHRRLREAAAANVRTRNDRQKCRQEAFYAPGITLSSQGLWENRPERMATDGVCPDHAWRRIVGTLFADASHSRDRGVPSLC